MTVISRYRSARAEESGLNASTTRPSSSHSRGKSSVRTPTGPRSNRRSSRTELRAICEARRFRPTICLEMRRAGASPHAPSRVTVGARTHNERGQAGSTADARRDWRLRVRRRPGDQRRDQEGEQVARRQARDQLHQRADGASRGQVMIQAAGWFPATRPSGRPDEKRGGRARSRTPETVWSSTPGNPVVQASKIVAVVVCAENPAVGQSSRRAGRAS